MASDEWKNEGGTLTDAGMGPSVPWPQPGNHSYASGSSLLFSGPSSTWQSISLYLYPLYINNTQH